MNLSDLTRMRNRKRNLSETVVYALLLSGAIALVTSILYSSSILASRAQDLDINVDACIMLECTSKQYPLLENLKNFFYSNSL